MLSALQYCGASLDDYLHLLVPAIVKVFQNPTNPIEARMLVVHVYMEFFNFFNSIALETIEKLSSSLDFSDYCSQIIHAVVDVLGAVHQLWLSFSLYFRHII